MKIWITNGNIYLMAETPEEGIQLGTLQRDAAEQCLEAWVLGSGATICIAGRRKI